MDHSQGNFLDVRSPGSPRSTAKLCRLATVQTTKSLHALAISGHISLAFDLVTRRNLAQLKKKKKKVYACRSRDFYFLSYIKNSQLCVCLVLVGHITQGSVPSSKAGLFPHEIDMTAMYYCVGSPQGDGGADAEIKVPSGENTELYRSPFKDWSRSAYSHTCHAYCQGFLPYLF